MNFGNFFGELPKREIITSQKFQKLIKNLNFKSVEEDEKFCLMKK
jgi:hypothetical protein